MERAYDKKAIALAQAETALRLYFEDKEHFSVITLAGAAEEIFGKLLEAKGIENSFGSLKKAVAEMHQHLFMEGLADEAIATRANRARNQLKHLGTTHNVTLDAKQEAQDMLQRVIDNYWLLEARLTPAMERFQREALGGFASEGGTRPVEVHFLNIRERIRHLHPGQVSILVLVGAVCVVGLLLVRAKAARAEGGARFWVSSTAGLLRSVNDSLNDPSNALHNPFDSLVNPGGHAQVTQALRQRRAMLDSIQAQSRIDLSRSEFQVFGLDIVIVVAVGLSLWILWVWFGGRRTAASRLL